jgi:hypothetical protein
MMEKKPVAIPQKYGMLRRYPTCIPIIALLMVFGPGVNVVTKVKMNTGTKSISMNHSSVDYSRVGQVYRKKIPGKIPGRKS